MARKSAKRDSDTVNDGRFTNRIASGPGAMLANGYKDTSRASATLQDPPHYHAGVTFLLRIAAEGGPRLAMTL